MIHQITRNLQHSLPLHLRKGISVLCVKVPNSELHSSFNLIEFQNNLTVTAEQFKGYQKSYSFNVDGYIDKQPIINLSFWKDKESWVKFLESKERKNLKNYYKGFIHKDDHYILTERHVKYDIPLL